MLGKAGQRCARLAQGPCLGKFGVPGKAGQRCARLVQRAARREQGTRTRTWCQARIVAPDTMPMNTSQAAWQHGMNYTGPSDSSLFLTLQTYCGQNKLPEEWKELIPEMSALFVDIWSLVVIPAVMESFSPKGEGEAAEAWHVKIYGIRHKFGIVYVLLMLVSLVMWMEDAGKTTTNSYCGFGMFLAW